MSSKKDLLELLPGLPTVWKQAWAVETGKFQEGLEDPDPAKWKANLRCALNKSREFQLTYDGTKETPVNPVKVYRVLQGPPAPDGAEEDEEDEMPNLMELSLHPRAGDPPFAQVIPMPLLPVTSDLQAQMGGALPDLDPPAPPPGGPPPPPTPWRASAMGAFQTQDQDQDQARTQQYDLLSSVPLTDLDLRFQYRGRVAGALTVSNPQGCRLFSGHLEPAPPGGGGLLGPQQEELFGPLGLQQVRFPGTAQLQNHKQRFYTDALLDAMDRGLVLELLDQDLYAVRLCQCKVFWSGPGEPDQGPPNPMERERKIRVFSLNDFLNGLIRFQKGEVQNPPPFEIYFCFGEDWPDRKPKEKKLIMVQVVPVVARILIEMFSGELSWSTDSIRLQISNPDVKDQTVEQFKELQRLLQSQQGPGPWGAPHGP
ncbi:interferon regulatory factor 5 [Menidia menidia]